MTAYTYDMTIYLEKDRQNATQTMTVTHVTLKFLPRRVEQVDHKLYMDNLLFSPDVYDDLHIHTRAVNCCKTV
jgi:hypothetical protein